MVADRAHLLELIRGFRVSQAIYVVTRLGIPDLLADGPRNVDELARATDAHPMSLRRLLSFLVAVGVLDQVAPGRVALAPMAATLRTGVPGSVRSAVLFLLDESHWRPWGHLLHSVRTGETAFHHTHGMDLFDYLAAHPAAAALFNEGMAGNSPAHARLVATTYDFSRADLVVDVAGGRGRLLATILEQYPRLRGILFEQPQVIGRARQLLEESEVSDRCDFVGGSFFDVVPPGGDVYVLRNIIHDWQDDEAIAILTTCGRAMTGRARLVLVEREIATDPRAALVVHHSDLEMLVNVGGRERTTAEYAALLRSSGLRVTRTISLGSAAEAMGHQLIEAQLDS